MLLIIDAYNVLHQLTKTTGEEAKQQFINQLINYASRKNHKLLVVFDGGPSPIASRERRDDVTLVHVGYKETADDYIKRVLDEGRKDSVLVSSDNALIKHARLLGIETVDSSTFAKLLVEKKVVAPTSIAGTKMTKLNQAANATEAEVAALLEQESRHLPVKEEDVTTKFKTKHTPSKKEKQFSKILKKL